MDKNKQRIIRLIYLRMIEDISLAEENELKGWVSRDVQNQKFFDEASGGK